MEEGIRTLPGIPREFHSQKIMAMELSLKWSHPEEKEAVTYYEVYIREEDYANNKNYPYRLVSSSFTFTIL